MDNAFLVLRGAAASVWAHAIPSQPIWAGRSKSCQIYLSHETVSRKHAEFRGEQGKLWLKDGDSRNGSFVNDTAVTESEIAIGDVIRLGNVVLEIMDEATIKQATAELEHKATHVGPGRTDSRAHKSTIERLTATQLVVLRRLLSGRSEKEIAAELFVSPHTVHSHIQAVYRELSVASRAELMATFISPALIERACGTS